MTSVNHLIVLYSIMELQLYQVCVFIMVVCSILTACKDAYNTQEEQLSCSVGCNLNANEDTYICTNEVRERLQLVRKRRSKQENDHFCITI